MAFVCDSIDGPHCINPQRNNLTYVIDLVGLTFFSLTFLIIVIFDTETKTVWQKMDLVIRIFKKSYRMFCCYGANVN